MWDWEPKKDAKLVEAVQTFLIERNYILPDEVRYVPGYVRNERS